MPTPPIKCIPCRVTFEGVRYRIKSDGTVYPVSGAGSSYKRYETEAEAIQAAHGRQVTKHSEPIQRRISW